MELACYVISLIKFKKETCTHAFLSKLWGITLLIAFTSLIGFNHTGIPFYSAVILGLISHIDVILIILILPKWTHDIPSAYHAYLIRKGIMFKENKYLNPLYAIENLLHLVATANTTATLRFLISP